jgi:hypothetical protein
LKLIYEFEIKKCNQLILRRLQKHDIDPETKEHTGKISFENMQACFRASSWISEKEINALLRGYVIKHGYESISYMDFEQDLYNVRFELTKSRIMDTSLPDLEDLIIQKCLTLSEDGKKI